MMLTRRSLLALGAGAVLLSRTARADEPSVDDMLQKVQKARAGLKSLEGPFTQVRKIGLLAAEVRSSGVMTLVTPSRLRWELGPPDEVTYWITPDGLAYKGKNGSGRVQGVSARVAAALDDLRCVLGGDLSQLRTRYDLKLVPTTDGTASFEATPKAGNPTHVKKIAFVLASDLVRPLRATLVEGDRDRSDIVFSDLKRDVPVDPERMKPPV